VAYIDGTAWIEWGERGHETAADRRIGRRIRGAAIEIRPFEFVSVNGDVPSPRKILETADMIEMTMSHDDRGGTDICTEAFFGGVDDHRGGAHHACVYQNPASIAGSGHAEKDDIHDRETPIRKIGTNLMRFVVARSIGDRIVGAVIGVERNLSGHLLRILPRSRKRIQPPSTRMVLIRAKLQG